MSSSTFGARIAQVLEFADARGPELQALHETASCAQLATDGEIKIETQRRLRRRRANAFKAYRLPRRLRTDKPSQSENRQEEEYIGLSAKKQLTQTSEPLVQPSDPSTRSRKHRRRPQQLAIERSWQHTQAVNAQSNGEQASKNVWLATHLWHAKRMHMASRYGMQLPTRRCDKSVSASLQALRQKATVHDMSYYGLLELDGRAQLILEVLELVTDPGASDLEDESIVLGKQEGQSMLYHANEFPRCAICPVKFMWLPQRSDQKDASDIEPLSDDWKNSRRQVWLWIHSASFVEAANAIGSACRAVVSPNESIFVLDRRGELCRFKLRGKESASILRTLLQQPKAAHRDDTPDLDVDAKDLGGYTPNDVMTFGLHNLGIFQRDLNATSNKNGVVYSVVAQDPRVRHKREEEKATAWSSSLSLLQEPNASFTDVTCPVSGVSLTTTQSGDDEPDTALILQQLDHITSWTRQAESNGNDPKATYPNVPPHKVQICSDDVEMTNADENTCHPCSLLCSVSGRKDIADAFRPDDELNQELYEERRQHRLGAPSRSMELRSKHDGKLHLMLIYQKDKFPSTGGWDMIMSPAYAPSLLHALSFAGALVVGLEEDEALSTVVNECSFPRDYPDTKAGEAYWKELASDLEKKDKNRPKGKRYLYEKDGVSNPFQPEWHHLFSSDEDTEESFCVLRGKDYLEPFGFHGVDEEDEEREVVPMAIPTLIRVTILFPRRGRVEPNAMLFAPTPDEQKLYATRSNWHGTEVKKGSKKQVKNRDVIGYVTSAIYDKPKGAYRAIGFCECDRLQHLAISQSTPEGYMVMLLPPRGNIYRPVLLHIEAN